MGKMIFSIGTLSECIKVKRIMERRLIHVAIVKVEERKSKNGCAYGIEFFQKDLYSVVHILSNESIPYYTYT